jgi:Domain of Unknown Function (DUF928)
MLWQKLRSFVFASLLISILFQSSLISTSVAKKVTFEPPKGLPAPVVTAGGGRRGGGKCGVSHSSDSVTTVDNKLTPLLPSGKLGITTSPNPTFMVYVPQSSAKAIEFTLENQKGDGIYQTTVNLQSTPAVVSVPLPKDEGQLEVGKDYKWIVSLQCQPSSTGDPFESGLVRRIQLDISLTKKLNAAKPLDKIELYGKSGVWFEAVGNLAALRRDQPKNPQLHQAWKDLLESVGLDSIANAPLQ